MLQCLVIGTARKFVENDHDQQLTSPVEQHVEVRCQCDNRVFGADGLNISMFRDSE